MPLDATWHARWQAAHQTAREKYGRMLDGRDTFEVAPLLVLQGELGAADYKSRCFLPRGLVTPGAYVVVRGLRFFVGNEEFYPPGQGG